MKCYAKYKPTGIAWLPQVPEHWEQYKLRQLLRPFSEKNHPDMPLLSVVREKGVIVRNIEDTDENHNYIPDDLSGYKLVRRGQFAMNKMKAWQGSYGVSKYDGIVSPAYFVFDINFDMNEDFFHKALRSQTYINYFGQASDGIRVGQWDLSMKRMKEIPFFLPPREEQDQIVRFLDWKMARINKLISIKNKQIEKLKYLKFFYISKAVTNGIDDHGILSDAFFGLQWSRVKIGYKAWIRARLGWRGLKATEYVEKGYPFLSAFNIVDDKLSWVNLNFINQYRYDESPEIKLSVGDILLVKDGAGIGKCARIDNLPYGESTPNGSLAVITPKEGLSYKYLYFYFISNHFKNAMNKIITGMGVPHLTQHFLKNVEIPCPPLDMQNKIVAYLDTESKMFNSMIAIKKSEIDKLKELRLRLISDVVTGKIDVRDIEIPEYESVEDVLDENTEDAEEEEMTAVEEE